MFLSPPLDDIYITKQTATTLEICYRNLHEPKKLQIYKMVLYKKNMLENKWLTKSIAVFNEENNRFEAIGSLYSVELTDSIRTTLVNYLELGHGDMKPRQIVNTSGRP